MDNKKTVSTILKDAFTPRKELTRKAYMITAVISFLTIFVVWLILTEGGYVDTSFLPTPKETIEALVELFTNQDYMSDIGISTYRVMTGFLISAVVAVPLGLLIGTYAPFNAWIEPVITFVRYLPATAFIPLFILWIGIDETQKIAVIIMGSLPQLILMVAVDTKKVPHDLVEVSYTLGTPKSHVIWKIILPASLPYIVDSLRMVLGWAWTYVIVAEMVGASAGIGYMTIQSQRMLNVANIFVGLLSIGLLGLIFDFIFKMIDKICFSWK